MAKTQVHRRRRTLLLGHLLFAAYFKVVRAIIPIVAVIVKEFLSMSAINVDEDTCSLQRRFMQAISKRVTFPQVIGHVPLAQAARKAAAAAFGFIQSSSSFFRSTSFTFTSMPRTTYSKSILNTSTADGSGPKSCLLSFKVDPRIPQVLNSQRHDHLRRFAVRNTNFHHLTDLHEDKCGL